MMKIAKVNTCVKNVYEIWEKTKDKKIYTACIL